MRKLMIILPAAILALILTAHTTPASAPESNAEARTTASPYPSKGLPQCTEEDGYGMALCMWDAQAQGNGMGTSVVSGDCAPDYVGGNEASAVCVALYSQDGYTIPNEDGSSNTVPNGKSLVQECNEIMELTPRIEGDYISHIDCFRAMM